MSKWQKLFWPLCSQEWKYGTHNFSPSTWQHNNFLTDFFPFKKLFVWHFSFCLLTFFLLLHQHCCYCCLAFKFRRAEDFSSRRNRMDFMAKGRREGRRKMNDIYATWSEYESLIRITWNLEKKLLWLLHNNIRLSKRLRRMKLLNFGHNSQTHNSQMESRRKIVFIKFLLYNQRSLSYLILLQSVWEFASLHRHQLSGKRFSYCATWCHLRESKVSFILIIVIIWLIECQWDLNAELS